MSAIHFEQTEEELCLALPTEPSLQFRNVAGKANGKKRDRIKRFPVGESSKEHLLLQFYTTRCSSEAYLDGDFVLLVSLLKGGSVFCRGAPEGSKMSTEAQRVDDSPGTSGGSSDGDQRESVQQEPEREQVQPKKKEGKISSKTAAKLSTSAKRIQKELAEITLDPPPNCRGSSVLGCLEVGDPAAPCGPFSSRSRPCERALPLTSTLPSGSTPHVHGHAGPAPYVDAPCGPCPSRRRSLWAPPLTLMAMRAPPLT
ncbi:hypothetical protein E5288_WYG020482 [Bos mutus]|uniref:Ubiquitin-conjugating enzyme E2 E2 n=1 Tax=Bos mutus TaxID=72004 RepID=A0A6B0S2Q4_9CETA|nr:hypothetical protein [Bos mutus]